MGRWHIFCALVLVSLWIAPASGVDDVIVDWNKVLLDAIRTDTGSANPAGPGPGWTSRAGAMVHGAMFDAINDAASTHAYQPYLYSNLSPNASPIAAAAQAARDVLAGLYPAQVTTFDNHLATTLATLANNQAKTDGVALGHSAAQLMLNTRANDGAAAQSNYQVTNAVGHWQPDPLHSGQSAWGPVWGNVTPFVLTNGQQFRNIIPAPPALTSAAYATAYNQVKDYGVATNSARSPDQTIIGKYWGYDIGGLGPPPVLYNEIAQVISKNQSNSLQQNARMFALVNMAMADAGIVAWDAKFQYDFWRPITAIRQGNDDNNAATAGVSDWTPLGAPNGNDPFTPPFPAYTSGHASFGGALFQTLADFYGTDNVPFTFASDEFKLGNGNPDPAFARTFTSLSYAAWENAESRIYLGIHWQFDADYGISSGDAVGNYVFAHSLTPLPEPSSVVLAGMGISFLILTQRKRLLRGTR